MSMTGPVLQPSFWQRQSPVGTLNTRTPVLGGCTAVCAPIYKQTVSAGYVLHTLHRRHDKPRIWGLEEHPVLMPLNCTALYKHAHHECAASFNTAAQQLMSVLHTHSTISSKKTMSACVARLGPQQTGPAGCTVLQRGDSCAPSLS